MAASLGGAASRRGYRDAGVTATRCLSECSISRTMPVAVSCICMHACSKALQAVAGSSCGQWQEDEMDEQEPDMAWRDVM